MNLGIHDIDLLTEGLRLIRNNRIKRLQDQVHASSEIAQIFGELADLEAKMEAEMVRIANIARTK